MEGRAEAVVGVDIAEMLLLELTEGEADLSDSAEEEKMRGN